MAGLWSGGYALGAQPADETRNQAGGGAFTLFTTSSRATAARGAELRIGVRLGRCLALEAGGSWARASVTTRVSGDAEQAPGVSATAGFAQYVVDGAVVLRLPRLAFARGRAVPFAEAGAGYLRQLYAGRVLAGTRIGRPRGRGAPRLAAVATGRLAEARGRAGRRAAGGAPPGASTWPGAGAAPGCPRCPQRRAGRGV